MLFIAGLIFGVLIFSILYTCFLIEINKLLNRLENVKSVKKDGKPKPFKNVVIYDEYRQRYFSAFVDTKGNWKITNYEDSEYPPVVCKYIELGN